MDKSPLNTLLVVDDSVFDHQVIARLLQVVEGLRVIFASGGKEAMQTLDRELPQLILTDLIMPDMDGLELVQQVRDRFPSTPIILMTAFGSEEAAMRALRAGAANYIPKKDLARDLVETVRGILRMSTVDRHRRQLLHCLNCRESTFLLENDPNLIASLMELVQEELDGLGRVRSDGTDKGGHRAPGSADQRSFSWQPRGQLQPSGRGRAALFQ